MKPHYVIHNHYQHTPSYRESARMKMDASTFHVQCSEQTLRAAEDVYQYRLKHNLSGDVRIAAIRGRRRELSEKPCEPDSCNGEAAIGSSDVSPHGPGYAVVLDNNPSSLPEAIWDVLLAAEQRFVGDMKGGSVAPESEPQKRRKTLEVCKDLEVCVPSSSGHCPSAPTQAGSDEVDPAPCSASQELSRAPSSASHLSYCDKVRDAEAPRDSGRSSEVTCSAARSTEAVDQILWATVDEAMADGGGVQGLDCRVNLSPADEEHEVSLLLCSCLAPYRSLDVTVGGAAVVLSGSKHLVLVIAGSTLRDADALLSMKNEAGGPQSFIADAAACQERIIVGRKALKALIRANYDRQQCIQWDENRKNKPGSSFGVQFHALVVNEPSSASRNAQAVLRWRQRYLVPRPADQLSTDSPLSQPPALLSPSPSESQRSVAISPFAGPHQSEEQYDIEVESALRDLSAAAIATSSAVREDSEPGYHSWHWLTPNDVQQSVSAVLDLARFECYLTSLGGSVADTSRRDAEISAARCLSARVCTMIRLGLLDSTKIRMDLEGRLRETCSAMEKDYNTRSLWQSTMAVVLKFACHFAQLASGPRAPTTNVATESIGEVLKQALPEDFAATVLRAAATPLGSKVGTAKALLRKAMLTPTHGVSTVSGCCDGHEELAATAYERFVAVQRELEWGGDDNFLVHWAGAAFYRAREVESEKNPHDFCGKILSSKGNFCCQSECTSCSCRCCLSLVLTARETERYVNFVIDWLLVLLTRAGPCSPADNTTAARAATGHYFDHEHGAASAAAIFQNLKCAALELEFLSVYCACPETDPGIEVNSSPFDRAVVLGCLANACLDMYNAFQDM